MSIARPVSTPRLIALAAFAFSLSLTMGVLEPAVFGRKVLELASADRNTALGFVTFAALLVATVTQPLVGYLSDRTKSRFGRRLPFMFVGSAMVTACLYLIALAPSFPWFAAGVLLVQMSSNTVQAPWQALFPDYVPLAQRGQASAIRAVLEVLASLSGRYIAGELVGRFPQWGSSAIIAAVSVPVVVMFLVFAATASGLRGMQALENRSHDPDLRQRGFFEVRWKDAPGFGWWLTNRFLFWIGFISVTTFLLFFTIDVLGFSEANAQKFIGKISAVLGIVLLGSIVPIGRWSDRIGRRPLVIGAGVLTAIGTSAIVFTRDVAVVTVCSGVIGLGIAMYLSVNFALITEIVPANEAARYLGIANMATAGGSAVARLIGGISIDAVNRASGSRSAGYIAVYAGAAFAFLLSALAATMLPERTGSGSPPPAA